MNKRIRSMIDEIFAEMKMTAENLALRDELLSNAQARYEDAMAQGKSEEEAFCEIAASLEDVGELLEQMNGTQAGREQAAAQETDGHAGPQRDLGEALGKAFTALGDFSQALKPEAKKLYGQMDEATGGVLGKLGRAAKKGMRGAQKAAGEAIDRLSKESGELVFDFGANREAKQAHEQKSEQEPEQKPEQEAGQQPEEFVSDFGTVTQPKEEASAQPAGELVLDMDALREPEGQARPEQPDMPDYVQADGEIDEEALARAVEDMARDVQDAIHEAGQDEAKYAVHDAQESASGMRSIPAAGLRRIDVQLDADDIQIVAIDGTQVETLWEAQDADGEPVIEYANHTLTIRRKNPDVFKTFFSVFKKEGGRITVRVPRGYAADYVLSTTSGDVHICDVDADNVKVSTTSGSVRVEPDTGARAESIAVTTVSGHATVSALADTIAVTTVSGGQFIACDAHKADVNVVSGKVHAEGACDEWEVSSVSGEVELLCTVAPAKKVQISSVHGDVRLALPGTIRGFVAEATGALGCEIINEFGPNRYGTCGLPIRMETMHGKLLITKL